MNSRKMNVERKLKGIETTWQRFRVWLQTILYRLVMEIRMGKKGEAGYAFRAARGGSLQGIQQTDLLHLRTQDNMSEIMD